MTRLFVGNLPWSATESDLRQLFSTVGEVSDVALITDRDTGRSRGFGFVEMGAEDAKKAIADLDGHDLNGRALRVNEAQERRPRNDNQDRDRW